LFNICTRIVELYWRSGAGIVGVTWKGIMGYGIRLLNFALGLIKYVIAAYTKAFFALEPSVAQKKCLAMEMLSLRFFADDSKDTPW
jgi:hypothetical protein